MNCIKKMITSYRKIKISYLANELNTTVEKTERYIIHLILNDKEV